MKDLHKLGIQQLLNLEFGQHAKSVHQSLTAPAEIEDVILKAYLENLKKNSDEFDRAMVQIAKNDETIKIAELDRKRDNAIIALVRFLNVYEYTDDSAKDEAFLSLYTLFTAYKNLPAWNFERETNGIDNLITDLKAAKYLPFTQLLGLTPFINRLETDNTAFKKAFADRSEGISSKEVFNVKELRLALKESYENTVEYLHTMAKAKSSDPEYSDALKRLNTIRKYYSDMLAKRAKSKKAEETPIPPIK